MENHPEFLNHQESGVYGKPSRIFKPSRIRRIWKTIQNFLSIKNQAYMENHPEFFNNQESGVYGKPSRIFKPSRIRRIWKTIKNQAYMEHHQFFFKPSRIRRIWKTIQNFLTINNHAYMENHPEFLTIKNQAYMENHQEFLKHQESGVYGKPSRIFKPSSIRRIWKTIQNF